MKAIHYLFHTCFKRDNELDTLKEEILVLEIEKERILALNPSTSQRYFMQKHIPCDQVYFFSKISGKQISRTDKLIEINEEIKELEKNLIGAMSPESNK